MNDNIEKIGEANITPSEQPIEGNPTHLDDTIISGTQKVKEHIDEVVGDSLDGGKAVQPPPAELGSPASVDSLAAEKPKAQEDKKLKLGEEVVRDSASGSGKKRKAGRKTLIKGIRGTKGVIEGYRANREISKEIALADAGGRMALEGVPAWYLGSKLLSTDMVQLAVWTGSKWVTYVLPLASALPLVGTLLGRRIYAKIIHRDVQDSFANACNLQVPEGASDKQREEISAAQRKLRKMILDRKWKSDDKLLNPKDDSIKDDDGTVVDDTAFLRMFWAAEFAKPAKIPNYHSIERYTKACIVRFQKLCKKAAEGEKLSGVSAEDVKRLAKLHVLIQQDPHHAPERLVRLCVCYARMLADHERRKGEAQITGGVAGTTAAIVLSTGAWAAPLVVGGGVWGLRYLYRKARRAPQSMEFSVTGELEGKGGGPLPSPEMTGTKGSALFRPDVLLDWSEEGQLSSFEAKEFFKLIAIPKHLEDKKFKRARDLMYAAAPFVLSSLVGKTYPTKKPSEDAIKSLERNKEKIEETLKNLQVEEKRAQGRINSISHQIKEESMFIKEKEDKDNAAKIRSEILLPNLLAEANEKISLLQKKGKAKSPDFAQALKERKNIESQIEADRNAMRYSVGRVDDVTRSRSRLVSLNNELVEVQGELNALLAQICQQRDVELEKAHAAAVQARAGKTDVPEVKLTRELIAENEDILHAFCVKVNVLFKKMKEEPGKSGIFSGALKSVGGTLTEAGKAAITHTVEFGASAGIGGAGGAGIAWLGGASMVQFATVGAVIGGVLHVYRKLKGKK